MGFFDTQGKKANHDISFETNTKPQKKNVNLNKSLLLRAIVDISDFALRWKLQGREEEFLHLPQFMLQVTPPPPPPPPQLENVPPSLITLNLAISPAIISPTAIVARMKP